jgi:alkyl sulfatase BDS1-like metallo-beta-lactamase superfamily hydrolase
MSQEQGHDPKCATPHTCGHNHSLLDQLPFGDTQDFADAQRGFIATLPDVTIRSKQGHVVWSLADYAFLAHEPAPDSVNPSLWRQARLNMSNGLYQITDRIYQVRGFDISNMTIIEGARGIIVIDPLISVETAAAALELYFVHRGKKPVTAVIYSHSHVDHFGGVRGVVDEADVRAGHVAVIAPDKFLEEVTKENILIGSPMIRRSMFQFGPTLAKGPRGQVDAGLGKTTSRGTVSLIPPTMIIRQPVETHRIDGVEILFQLTPDSEAPAEMHMFYPELKALNLAENATHNLHNIYPIRGAQVRDCNAWSKYLGHALHHYAPKSEVVFAQHHWPVWGQSRLSDFLTKQRDTYKFLHDQTLRLMNHGMKAADIAEQLALPKSLSTNWSSRGYYGTLSHNSKAVYQRYIGWYDGNPANLAPLPPVERGRKMIEYMGGAAAAIARAREDYEKGDYRWIAEIMNAVVFAEPDNRDARLLCADAFEQLGYQAESATWRNAYLLGAHELRHGLPKLNRVPVREDFISAITIPMFFDYLAIRINAAKADGKRIIINWTFGGGEDAETHVSTLDNSALTYLTDTHIESADAHVRLNRDILNAMLMKRQSLMQALAAGQATLTGNAAMVADLFDMIDDFPINFSVVEPGIR